MSVRADISVQLVWAIANTEAQFAGETQIRPMHLFLGILKVIDPKFATHLRDVEMPDEERKNLAEVAKQIRHFLEMSIEEITRLRRSLREQLRKGKPEPAEIRMLHRSEESREGFRIAGGKVVQSGDVSFSALHLAESLFETGYVSLDSIKRPPTRPSTKGARWEVVEDGKDHGGRRFYDWFGRNLTRMASEGRLAPFEGRDDVLRKMLRILARTNKRHIAVIGKPGVGKTAVVEGLAAMLARRKPTGRLINCEILELHGSDIASDCSRESEVSRRISYLFRLLNRRKTAVFFLDDLHGLFPGHLKSDAVLALLTTLLADGATPCIVTSLNETWAALTNNAPSLTRLFNIVQLDDPPPADCRRIVAAWAKRIGDVQRTIFATEAVDAILDMAGNLPAERAMPDKIVDLIENIATFVKVSSLSSGSRPHKVTEADVKTVLAEHYGIRIERAPRCVGEKTSHA